MEATKNHRKSKKHETPEYQFTAVLNRHSKSKDLRSALYIYDSATATATPRLSTHHFNTLLYLCSATATESDDPTLKSLALEYGFRIYDHMVGSGLTPNEASITSVVRLAAAKGDGEFGLGLVKKMGSYGLTPKLRTCSPVLFCLCEKLEWGKAYEVEAHMVENGVSLEESEIAALLRVSVECDREEKVYEYLHRLRANVGCVREETAKAIEDWFSKFEGGNGVELDLEVRREAVVRNGGGWLGMGWIGKGRKWVLKRGSLVDTSGKCCGCEEQLVCVDVGDAETERFADSIVGLALEREVKANFAEFQDWLDKHSHFEAIVDGANISLYQQNFAEGAFSVPQLDAVVKELHSRSQKWPLIILHNKRRRALLENPAHRELIQEWMEKDIIYATPHGSNDDWYWLYAAVKLRCLLVTNDEMRDHIFELLARSFFLKWKERHQVRYTFVKGRLKLQMPPPFSLVIQESAEGSWHVPISSSSAENCAQSWLCITRENVHGSSEQDVLINGTAENGHVLATFYNKLENKNSSMDSHELGVAGKKRKERSPSRDDHGSSSNQENEPN